MRAHCASYDNGFKICHKNRIKRPDLFALKIRPKRVLFKEIIEVDERTNSNGEVLSSVDVNTLAQQLKTMRKRGITSAAVVSYA